MDEKHWRVVLAMCHARLFPFICSSDSSLGHTQHYRCGATALDANFFVNNSINEIEKKIFEEENVARNRLKNRPLEPYRSISQICRERGKGVIHQIRFTPSS